MLSHRILLLYSTLPRQVQRRAMKIIRVLEHPLREMEFYSQEERKLQGGHIATIQFTKGGL